MVESIQNAQSCGLEESSPPQSGLQKLFSPFKLGRLLLRNRIVMPALSAGFDPPTGPPGPKTKDFYVARAQGGAGLIILPPGDWAFLDFTPPSAMNDALYRTWRTTGHKELVEAVHAWGAKVGIQLQHRGRQATREELGYQPVAPSPRRWSPNSDIPRELSHTEIEKVIECFVEAAAKAKEAGYDLVEIHGAHGYLLSSFLSPASNLRTDQYGGSLPNRARLLVEVVQAIKDRLGSDFPVSCRINGCDHIAGGLTVEESASAALLLQAAGVDVLSISAGAYGSYPTIVPPFDVPTGCHVDLTGAIKAAVQVPVIAAGRINDARLAEEVLLSGKADLIAMGRALVADPGLPEKAKRGQWEDVNKCIACNSCIDSHSKEGRIRCLVNPAVGTEQEGTPVHAKRTKKVMVIGGGLAGLEAAKAAASRGHQVVLYEERAELGGQWLLASVPPHKGEFAEVVTSLSREIRKLGVVVELGRSVNDALIAEQNPDVVVVATGAVPMQAGIPGIRRPEVVGAWDVLCGNSSVGHRVLVLGGGAVGLETADLLASQGKKVTVVEMLPRWGSGMGPTVLWHLWHRLKSSGVQIRTQTKVREIGDQGVVVETEGKVELLGNFDNIVLALGTNSKHSFSATILATVKEVYLVGDAARPRSGVNAVTEGFEAGLVI